MSKQNVPYQYGSKHMILQFEHCNVCAYFRGCYGEGEHGPHFLDENCVEGPVEEIQSAQEAANNLNKLLEEIKGHE